MQIDFSQQLNYVYQSFLWSNWGIYKKNCYNFLSGKDGHAKYSKIRVWNFFSKSSGCFYWESDLIGGCFFRGSNDFVTIFNSSKVNLFEFSWRSLVLLHFWFFSSAERYLSTFMFTTYYSLFILMNNSPQLIKITIKSFLLFWYAFYNLIFN